MTGQRHFQNCSGLGQTLKNNSKVKEETLKSAIQLFIHRRTVKLSLYVLRLNLETGDNTSKVCSTVSALC